MNLLGVTLSYVSSLFANAIILLGSVSIFTWFDRQTDKHFILKHKSVILTLLGVIFVLFVHGEAWSNVNLSQNLIGLHWTYLNVEIVALFNLTLRIRSVWQIVSTVALTMLWSLSNMHVFNWSALLLLGSLVVIEILTFYYANIICNHGFLYVASFVLNAGFVFLITTNIYGQQDWLSWIRQITALVILDLVVFTYSRMLRSQTSLLNLFKHQAQFDDLTSVRKLGVFNDDLEQLYNLYQDTGKMYAIYAIDIDHFKKINDNYGHIAGNQVLKRVAQRLDQIVKNVGYRARLYRTGGEEFTVILLDIAEDASRAEMISRRMQREVGQLSFEFDQLKVSVTISIGEECVNASDSNYLDAYKRADQFLYTSKNNGRNAITLRGRTLERI